MLGTILLLLLLPIIVLVLRWYYLVNHYEKYLKNIPGPKPLPLFGTTLELNPPEKILSKFVEYSKQYNGTFKFYIGAQAYLWITNPKDMEFFMSSTTILKKSDSYRFVLRWLGFGLLTSWANRWRKHRKIITPAFHFKILEEYVETFNAQSQILVSKLKRKADAGPIEISGMVYPCTFDMICDTSMGTIFNAQSEKESDYVNNVNKILDISWRRGTSIILANEFLYQFTSMYRKETKALEVVHGYTRKVIANKRKELSENVQREEYDSLGRKKKRCFIDLMMEHALKDSTFTDEDVRQEVDTFLFEGYETTATSTSFALYALATNPDVQRKVYEEVKEIFSDDPNRSATYTDLQDMKYMELFIKESLRRYTTVPLIGRAIEKDTNWNGTILPEGLMVHMFLYGTHISESVFKDPKKFDPERFNTENSAGRSPYANVPFSAGPRNCIGQKFAMVVMKMILSNVLRSFELRPAPARPEYELTLTTTGVLRGDKGIYIQVKNRE